MQLAELAVVVGAWGMEQGCEVLDVEDSMEAMQLPVLPMNLAEEEVVGELEVQLAQAEVEVIDGDVVVTVVEQALIQA